MEATFQELATRLGGAVGTLNAEDTQYRPAARWSIQQIAEHLMLTYTSTEALLRERLMKGRPTQARPGLRQHCGRLLVVGLGYFPHGVPAPSRVTPPGNSPPLSGAELLNQLVDHLERLDLALDGAANAFGPKTRSASHIFLGPMNPGEWRRFHLIHGLHHVRQIRKIVHDARIPSR